LAVKVVEMQQREPLPLNTGRSGLGLPTDRAGKGEQAGEAQADDPDHQEAPVSAMPLRFSATSAMIGLASIWS